MSVVDLLSMSVFESFKCVRPIPHAGGLVADLLIQLSLDPTVESIDMVTTVATRHGIVDVDAISIRRGGDDFVIDYEPSRKLRTPRDHDLVRHAISALGHRALEISSAEIMRDPRFSETRMVWSCRRLAVPLTTRLAIARAIEEAGSPTLHELCTAVPGPVDPVSAVCALACAGALAIDLSDGLRPATIVRSWS